MRTSTKILSSLLLLGASLQASAAIVWTTSGPFSPLAGTCTVDFDGSTCAGVSYSDLDSNSVVTGFVSGVYAQPVGSTGKYLTVGPSAGTPNTITFVVPATNYNYFGMLAGSLDTYNSLTFQLLGGGSLSFTGSQIAAAAGINPNGNQGLATYWNILLDAGQTYTSIRLASTDNAFETDNHAFGAVTVPEPATLGLLGLGLLGAGFARRRKPTAA